MSLQIEPIGIVHSCFKEKFGIPRQPGLIASASAVVELFTPYNRAEAVRGLEAFSHIWLLFIFHEAQRQQWSATVRPPRLGGNKRVGVFASRSPFRPNPIGMSVVTLDAVEITDKRLLLHISGIDILDKTPVIDIKPYLNYVDAIPTARGGFAAEAPLKKLHVVFTPQALIECEQHQTNRPQLRTLIEEVVALDPRPAYMSDSDQEREYGLRLFDFDLRWRVEGELALILELHPQKSLL
ncbi:MAG: SAM-binding protein [Halothiobacillaceae bacterium]|nr:MAG: SAM-binding protein [Halothiobacillaceae bacterium]